jgi:uncharacterized protein
VNDPIFVDTGAWYAAQTPNDRWHSEAAKTLRILITRHREIVTSNLVIGETYTLLLRTHGHAASVKFVDQVHQSRRVRIIYVDEDTELDAYALLRRFADQAFSYVDGTSFVVMKRHRLRAAFAFDQHFATAGFVRVPIDQKA